MVSSSALLTVNYFIETTEGQPRELATTNLTTASASQPGASFALTSTDPKSGAGGLVQLSNGIITYSPPPGYTGVDSFNYWLTPGSGPAVEGKITVLVDVAVVLGGVVNGGQVTMQFAGIPGTTYNIEASSDLQNWTFLGTATAGANGLFQFQDTVGSLGWWNCCYYRTSLAQ
jgi:hypothetical protein